MKKPSKKDNFLETLKREVEAIATDQDASRRDRNAAIANGIKLLQIEHKINPGEIEDFFP
jgi:hypothetical protein